MEEERTADKPEEESAGGKKAEEEKYKEEKKQAKRTGKLEKKKEKRIRKTEKKEAKRIRKLEKKEKSRTAPWRSSKRYSRPAPRLGLIEEIGNAVTHGVGAVLSFIALVFMLVYGKGWAEILAAVVYCFGLFVMFSISCLYHAFPRDSRVKNIFRHFDYMCIYLLIGATFAPLLLCVVGGVFGLAFFLVQWAAIATGITLIGVFGPGRLRYIHFPLYFVIGWSGLMFIPQMIRYSLPLFLWIIAGGVLYSLGMIPFALRKKVSHFIWHFFVLFGAVAQWIGIFRYIYLM